MGSCWAGAEPAQMMVKCRAAVRAPAGSGHCRPLLLQCLVMRAASRRADGPQGSRHHQAALHALRGVGTVHVASTA